MPFGHLYNLVLKARAAMYKKGFANSHDLGVPVISVGNLTVGGTGKTPLVAFVARVLAKNGRKVCILTRGYKREDPNKRVVVSDGEKILADAKQSGDEPFELAHKLLGISAVIADKDRAAAAVWAKEELGSDAFVLDDGFQHFQLKRALDLVTVDATDPFGNGWLLPQGTLREPVENLARADAIILTRANLAPNSDGPNGVNDLEALKAQVQGLAPAAAVFTSENKTTNLIPLAKLFEDQEPGTILTLLPKTRTLAFCAIGNPDSFFRQLMAEGFELAGTNKFPDHHKYSERDISTLNELARKWNADLLLTTIKDAVKLKGFSFDVPCYVVESTPVFDNEEGLRELIVKTLF
jgi:tetraacyldisaccharide 4'-kinase